MPSKDPTLRFRDILANLNRIAHHVESIPDEFAFAQNPTAQDAVERCLQRISEAATKLGPVAESLAPQIPWASVRALGNILRHEYDLVDPIRIWYTLQDDLEPLRQACQQAINDLSHHS